MAMKLYPDGAISDIADAIRAKNGSADTYTVSEMAQAIADLPTGNDLIEIDVVPATRSTNLIIPKVFNLSCLFELSSDEVTMPESGQNITYLFICQVTNNALGRYSRMDDTGREQSYNLTSTLTKRTDYTELYRANNDYFQDGVAYHIKIMETEAFR